MTKQNLIIAEDESNQAHLIAFRVLMQELDLAADYYAPQLTNNKNLDLNWFHRLVILAGGADVCDLAKTAEAHFEAAGLPIARYDLTLAERTP